MKNSQVSYLLNEVTKSLEDYEKDLDSLIDIQVKDPSNDSNPYMKGLSNGLLLAKGILNDIEPKFLGKNNERTYGFVEKGEVKHG